MKRARRCTPARNCGAWDVALNAVCVICSWRLCLVLSSRVNAESRFDFATTPGKLPKDVRPTEYSIRIAPDLQKLTFTGSETVRLHAEKPVTKLVLNALEMEIASASVDGRPLPKKAIVLDETEQTLTLNLPNELPAGDHELALAFSGKINAARAGTFLRALSGTGNERKEDHARDAIRGDRCAPDVSLLGRAEFSRAFPAHDSRPGKLHRRLQHAGAKRGKGRRRQGSTLCDLALNVELPRGARGRGTGFDREPNRMASNCGS